MKKRYVLLASILGVLSLGCGDDFLEAEPTQFLSVEQVGEAAENNPAVATALMSGVYSLMFETGTGGTTGHDDFGQKGYDIFTDMLTSDMALSASAYGWYTDITEYQTPQDYTSTRNYTPWRYYYRIIRSANLVIDANGGNEGEPEADQARWLNGQAKAMRAYAYFYLTQLYANSYDPAQEILPIYTQPDDENGPKVTTQEIYDLMISDLTDAISFLEDYNRTGKHEINKHVAEGLLAYVYASMGGYEQDIIDLTEDVITGGGFSIMTEEEVVYTPGSDLGGFNDVNTPGWMWGVDITLDNGLDLVSWWGQVDYFTYSYASAGDYKSIDAGLWGAIAADDIRKEQFDPNYVLMPVNKFYHEGRQPQGQRDITTDYVYMRVAEMYLLQAEAAAKMGDDITAQNALKAIVELRRPDATYIDGLTGEDLLDEIYFQTRVELWGEGKTYLALKRNQRSTMRGNNHLSFVGEVIQYDDERLTFEIPESEIQNNPHISTQN